MLITQWTLVASICGLSVAFAATCELPEPKEDVDWNKVSEGWYIAVHTNDSVMNEDVKCGVIRKIWPTDDGFTFAIRNYLGSENRDFKKHYIRQSKGTYKSNDINNAPDFINGEAFGSSGKLNVKALANDLYEMEHGVVYMTDYDNYLLRVSCGSTGERIVWGSTKSPNTTADEVISIWNALVEYGISTKLYTSGCSEIDFTK